MRAVRLQPAAVLLAIACATAPAGAQAPTAEPTFRGDVLPLLQQKGCASAYCHGAATGRGGFKLSLFGSDPAADWRAIASDLAGRRLDLAAPERSLLLRKPTAEVPHGGGRRLPRGETAHAVLRRWIAGGAPRGDLSAPDELRLARAGDRVTAAVRQHDRERDVTALCLFTSTDERVVRIDADGNLGRSGHGEAFVTARYAGLVATLRVVHARATTARPPARLHGQPSAAVHPADRAFRGWLGELGLDPGPAAPPLRLARRLHLDLAGRPPSAEEAEPLQDGDPAARLRAIDRLLASPAFTDTFTEHLAELFELPAPTALPREQQGRVVQVRERLRAAVAAGTPLDTLAEDLLQPGHPLLERHGDPRDRAEYVGRAFLGMRIGCARCHDHPDDRWTIGDHLGFAALVATRRDEDGTVLAGRVFDPETGDLVTPAMLDLGTGSAEPGSRDVDQNHAALRRAVLGGAFARNVSNRLLGILLGRAPVEPVDDHRATNPPLAAPLLAALVDQYRSTGGDLRALVRWIATSELYALDSDPGAGPDDELHARHLARRTARALPPALLARAEAFVLGARAPRALSGSPLLQALQRRNEPFLAAALATTGNPIDAIADWSPSDAVALRELFLQVLTRPPRADEEQALLPHLAGDRHARLREVARALCLSREFGSRR
jgi:hypothetical protein